MEETTVREAVILSARLRFPSSISDKEKCIRAMETIELTGLSSYSDILVKSLASAELKLLTMALGISAYSALVVANALRKIADTGTCVVCTVHQPSRGVFSIFDQLLLLKRGGKQVYFGDIGENAATLTTYFESNGPNKLVGETNPADQMLDAIAGEIQKLSAESSARISAEKHVSVMESDLRRVGQRVVQLESVEKKLRSDGKAMSEEMKTLQAGTDESELERGLQRLGDNRGLGVKSRRASQKCERHERSTELSGRSEALCGGEQPVDVGAGGYEERGDAPEEAELDAAVEGGRGGADDVQRPGGVGRALADTRERGAAAQSVEGAGGVGGGEERTQRGGETDAVD
ncbi:P-loop containing nucleoside triphosphate hydrolase [Gracilaria domingensis]|nr:P-loop containing nucleoside triphosphate hydrolase [Gracilaria domingensis]KAI0558848.1 P-loop containing nucleoside triphosphate hydrolase [Gracilaria domingensis]